VNTDDCLGDDAQQEPVALRTASGGADHRLGRLPHRAGQGYLCQRVMPPARFSGPANASLCAVKMDPRRGGDVPDGLGAQSLAWEDARSDTGGYDVYAQRINSADPQCGLPGRRSLHGIRQSAVSWHYFRWEGGCHRLLDRWAPLGDVKTSTPKSVLDGADSMDHQRRPGQRAFCVEHVCPAPQWSAMARQGPS